MRYVVQHRYRSTHAGPFEAGQVVEVDDDLAAFLAVDSPGLLVAEAAEPELGPVERDDTPAADRMARGPRGRR